jgi:hypothetical protein
VGVQAVQGKYEKKQDREQEKSPFMIVHRSVILLLVLSNTFFMKRSCFHTFAPNVFLNRVYTSASTFKNVNLSTGILTSVPEKPKFKGRN